MATEAELDPHERVRIVIDIREDALWDALEPEEGYSLEKAPLDVGDIAFFVRSATEDGAVTETEAVVLERKTVADLAASQRDGRYREQRARLLAKKGAGAAVGYMLEVQGTMPRIHGSSFTEAHLRSAILRLQLRYGLAVFQSTSVAATAQWIQQIAKALVADPAVFREGLAQSSAGAAAAYTEALHVKKATNLTADRVLATVFRTIPGVGPAAADAILAHVGAAGFPAFFALTEAELAAIPQGKRKVGPAVAKKMWQTFHGASVEPATA